MLIVFVRCNAIVLIVFQLEPTFIVVGLPRNLLLLPVIVS